MKTKITVAAIFVVVAIVAAYFFGMKKGANLVRYGLLANYPTTKNVVQSADIEIDSVLSFALTIENDSLLFNSLKNDLKTDKLQISIPYYGRYGVDLSVRNFRVFENEDAEVEVWLPDVTLRYCELKFDNMIVNGKVEEKNAASHKKMYEYLIPLLEKNKAGRKAAKMSTAKALMYYFMPYKFGLKLYIGNELQTLPLVPGVNQSVDDAIKEIIGKK